jgi:hypothetical protein
VAGGDEQDGQEEAGWSRYHALSVSRSVRSQPSAWATCRAYASSGTPIWPI